MKLPAASARSQRLSGATFVNGRVRGRISGFVDAEIHGVIRGDIAAIMSSGSFNQPGENAGGEGGESPAPEKNENEPAAVSGKEGAQE